MIQPPQNAKPSDDKLSVIKIYQLWHWKIVKASLLIYVQLWLIILCVVIIIIIIQSNFIRIALYFPDEQANVDGRSPLRWRDIKVIYFTDKDCPWQLNSLWSLAIVGLCHCSKTTCAAVHNFQAHVVCVRTSSARIWLCWNQHNTMFTYTINLFSSNKKSNWSKIKQCRTPDYTKRSWLCL